MIKRWATIYSFCLSIWPTQSIKVGIGAGSHLKLGENSANEAQAIRHFAMHEPVQRSDSAKLWLPLLKWTLRGERARRKRVCSGKREGARIEIQSSPCTSVGPAPIDASSRPGSTLSVGCDCNRCHYLSTLSRHTDLGLFAITHFWTVKQLQSLLAPKTSAQHCAPLWHLSCLVQFVFFSSLVSRNTRTAIAWSPIKHPWTRLRLRVFSVATTIK